MQLAKAIAIATASALVAIASLYQLLLLLWTGEIYSMFFFHRGHYVSLRDEPLTTLAQVVPYLFCAAIGCHGTLNVLSAPETD